MFFRTDSSPRGGRSVGFTLIELLIVVAIIAILAAIAIPNFLEAQVRAKVGHAQEEMHSLNIAIETYAVDWGVYPTCYGLPANLERLIPLTTPVAYLTSVPDDPFAIGEYAKMIGSDGYYDYIERNSVGQFFCDIDPGGTGALWFHPDRTGAGFPWMWRLVSLGPDQSFSHPPPPAAGHTDPDYDASNGTISIGNLWRYGPGNIQSILKAEPCLVSPVPCADLPSCN